MRTQVAIIGAGPAGLFLAHLLRLHGVAATVLERCGRTHAEGRVRAGVLEQITMDVMARLGLDGRLQARGLLHEGTNLVNDGEMFRIDMAARSAGRRIAVYGQQEVMRDLFEAATDIPVIFEAGGVALHAIADTRPYVTWRKDGTEARLDCDFIAGCDGFHGVSRGHIPHAARREFERVYPFGWLGILADVPPAHDELIYANHANGFALASMRSPSRSRYYLQCGMEESVADWPDERFWDEVTLRLGSQAHVTRGPSFEKSIAPLRSFVTEPMRHGRLFLLGDAAHIVPPTGAKGLNLAVSDAVMLSDALAEFYQSGHPAALDGYSERALNRVWKAERFSWWFTGLTHRFPETETFFTASLDLLVIRDAEFKIVKVNQAWEKVLGYRTEDLEGQFMLSFIHPDDVPASHSQMQRVKTEKDVDGFINRYRCRDGGYRHLEWRARQEGGLVYGIARDVTERLAIETEMAEAKAAVEAASKAKSEFLANMSHELRTPLNAILGFSEVIRDQVLGDAPSAWAKYKEYAGSIHASGSHLLSLISEVLDLSRIESGGYRLYVEQFGMQAVIRDSLMLVKPQAERAKISILPMDAEGDVTVDADKRAIKQVIVNLLANAVKFTPGGGEIEIRCYEENGTVHVRVRDSGIGIAEELLETVFEAFHRGDAKLARRYDGTGLGLSVCRRLVEMHGGRIWLESAPNTGTTVFFHLPKRSGMTANAERAA